MIKIIFKANFLKFQIISEASVFHSVNILKHFKYFFFINYSDFMTIHFILLFFFLFHYFINLNIHRKITPFEVEFYLAHVLNFIRFELVSIEYFVGPIYYYIWDMRIYLGMVGNLNYFVE